MLSRLLSRTLIPHTIKSNFAIVPFLLPDLGEKIKEAQVVKWHVKEGDLVEEFDTLADVATDKLAAEIPSTHTGKIHRIIVQQDEFCGVGMPLFEFDDLCNEMNTNTITQTVTEIKESSINQNNSELQDEQQEGIAYILLIEKMFAQHLRVLSQIVFLIN